MTANKLPSEFEIHPLTPDRWTDLERLFGEHGSDGGCWCMWFRLENREFEKMIGEPNRQAFKQIVSSGEEPGVLLYVDGQPAGWCAVAPRSTYPRLERSKASKPVDGQPTWVISCFFIDKSYRRRGYSTILIEGAVQFAAQHGAKIVEAHPVDNPKKQQDSFIYHGVVSSFEKAGFSVAARWSDRRPVMRRIIS